MQGSQPNLKKAQAAAQAALDKKALEPVLLDLSDEDSYTDYLLVVSARSDRQVRSIAGSPQLTQEVYALAAQVLADLVQSTGGDVGKLSEALERAQSDPGGFAATLSPQTLQQLRDLSDKIAGANR